MRGRIRRFLLCMTVALSVLCGCGNTQSDRIQDEQEQETATQKTPDEVNPAPAPVQAPPTVDSLLSQMRDHEKVEANVTVASKVSMVQSGSALSIPVGIDLNAEVALRGGTDASHIKGTAGVAALVLNYDYPFETYTFKEGDNVSVYLYHSDTDSWTKADGVLEGEGEIRSFLSLYDSFFTDAALTESGDGYVINAQITADKVKDLLFGQGMIDISALESIGFSLEGLRFDVSIVFDKDTRDIRTMTITCSEPTEINGFTMESFTVETTYLGFDGAVADVVLPQEIADGTV